MGVSAGGLVSIDCAEPQPLADFWAAMLGGEVVPVRDGVVLVRTGWVSLAVLRVPDHVAPTWPEGPIPQQIHLDLAVTDLDGATADAQRLGARLAPVQPAPDQWRVLFDPAGHPFCLTDQVPVDIVRHRRSPSPSPTTADEDGTPTARPASGVEAALEALDVYGTVTAFVDGLAPADFLAPTRCRGWTVGDLLLHLIGDAQRALVTFATPATSPPDVDFASYWTPFQPADTDEDDVARTRWLRVSASALSPAGLTELWRETASAAVRAAARVDPTVVLATQGHALTPVDFLLTLVVEATIHHLDLTVEFPAVAAPPDASLGVVRRTLDARLGESVRAPWDDITYALKATGRAPIDAADVAVLGRQARLLPLLG